MDTEKRTSGPVLYCWHETKAAYWHTGLYKPSTSKTARIHELLTGSGRQFFLSRPRRFGKSLLCSTLGAVFEGKRELFSRREGRAPLAIDTLDWDWKPHPVIRIDLNPGVYEQGIESLHNRINMNLESCARKYQVAFEGNDLSDRFARLIEQLSRHCGQRVAVIIDEYDKPLFNTIDNPALHAEMRSTLKGFYGTLKSSDEYLQFVFLTGVTKFTQVSVFSDLNHLTDLSLDPAFCDICGITQEELERDFASEIAEIVQNKDWNRDAYLNRLRRFYNGYRFSEKPLTLYNPFGILHHFRNGGKFLPYWFETGTPSFLISLIEKQRINILNMGKQSVRYEDFRRYDADNMEAVPVLYQSGYLTITGYNEERMRFALDYPNDEVRASFAESLVEKYLHVQKPSRESFIIRFMDAVYDGDVTGIMDALKPFFAIIEKENDYQTVVHLIFTMLGLQCRSEVRISSGRIDTLVETNKFETNKFVYCFEFKLNGSAEQALKQIDSKDYLLPWQGAGKKRFKVGVNFDHDKRAIGEWLMESNDDE